MTQTAIQRAVTIAGSQEKLAEAIGVTQGLVSQWCNGATIATRHFAAIEQATKVTAGELLVDEMAKANSAKRATDPNPPARRTSAAQGKAAETTGVSVLRTDQREAG